MTGETWREIPGFPGYDVSDKGRVRSRTVSKFNRKDEPLILKQHREKRLGYCAVGLQKNGKRYTRRVHTLVLLAFVGPPAHQQICCHRNGVRHDNELSNLEWGTYRKNLLDRRRHGTAPLGEKHWRTTLTSGDVRVIRRRAAAGELIYRIANDFGVSASSVSMIVAGKRWGHVG